MLDYKVLSPILKKLASSCTWLRRRRNISKRPPAGLSAIAFSPSSEDCGSVLSALRMLEKHTYIVEGGRRHRMVLSRRECLKRRKIINNILNHRKLFGIDNVSAHISRSQSSSTVLSVSLRPKLSLRICSYNRGQIWRRKSSMKHQVCCMLCFGDSMRTM